MVSRISGRGKLSRTGVKKHFADEFYRRGKMFLGSAYLLRNASPTLEAQTVSLHLIGQGIELVLKGLLLRYDYDSYVNRLHKTNDLGHNLLSVAREAARVYNLSLDNDAELMHELQEFSNRFAAHYFRYNLFKVEKWQELLNPADVRSGRIERWIADIVRTFDVEG